MLICLAGLTCFAGAARAQVELPGPTATVSGSYVLPNGTFLADFYTWGEIISFTGAGWLHNDTLTVHMSGPNNLPGVTPTDIIIGSITTDSNGRLVPGPQTRVKIPAVKRLSTQPSTPRPGSYTVYATRPAPTPFQPPVFSLPNTINLSPRTIPLSLPFPDFITWDKERGARDGQLGDLSPERTDPEWVSVWDERPVAFYATVTASGTNGDDQPAFISHSDYPGTHYGHDTDLLVVPDKEYLWLLADANYNAPITGAKPTESGRLEWEWETQNNGNPFGYGNGNIGIPVWAMPSAGDRIFSVGRWIMDNGHPDTGDRTEIHPGRMLATIRKRNTAVPLAPTGILTRASQVDIYVSGHGGGANQFPDDLSTILNNNGLGGGSTLEATSAPFNLTTYYAIGPSDSTRAKIITDLAGGNASAIQTVAGPSGLGFLNGPEERPINDMDYEFDVPLPHPPPGATHPLVQVHTQPEHTTRVNEVITYTKPDASGLPTTAHIHLFYNGADNGIYARQLYFYWDVFNKPGKHYSVRFIDVNDTYAYDADDHYPLGQPQWSLWTEVCGQWVHLGPASGLLTRTGSKISFINGPFFDVFLDPSDTMRVFTSGYERHSYDQLFGFTNDFGHVNQTRLTTYDEAISIAEATGLGDGDSDDLGGALFESTSFPTGVGINRKATRTKDTVSTFNVDFSITPIAAPPQLQVQGAPIDFGRVCNHGNLDHVVQITNTGEAPLLLGITLSGAGYSLVGAPTTFPISVAGGASLGLTVRFAPTQIDQGAGVLTIQSNDVLQPSATYSLSGTVGFPTLNATANTARTPTLTVGATTTWPVTITNPGTCVLSVKPTIVGAGFSFTLPSEYYSPLTGALLKDISVLPGQTNHDLTVQFTTPATSSKFVGTLTLTGNDPVHPTSTLIFGAEGVAPGVRVLVVHSDGTPYPIVDKISLKSKTLQLKDQTSLPLRTLNPPQTWKRIQYHYVAAPKPTTGSDVYQLTATVKGKSQTASFPLKTGEFKDLVLTIP